MSVRLACLAAALCLASAATASAQKQEPEYLIKRDKVEKDGRVEDRIHVARRPDDRGNSALYVTVQFMITRADGTPVFDVPPDEIVVKENDQIVKKLEVRPPTSLEPLTAMLAIDISGSMADHHKMDKSKEAAGVFLDRLDDKSQCGLILFDHLIRSREPPSSDRQRQRKQINAARPRGGTAYLDATSEAINMVQSAKGRKAVLLLTDGVDINSEHTMDQVIQQARSAEVPVYTIGVGEPGKNVPVSTVLVLDCSGSMSEPADDTDEISKIEALRQAAGRFIDIMRPGAQTTLIPFSTTVKAAGEFSTDKPGLKRKLRGLRAHGDTALFDAIYDGVETLVAGRVEGKRAVVVLTDGKDTNSQRDVDEVIAAARKAEIHLHLLGLGREGELDEPVMQRMARQTGGSYHHASNKQALYEIFEKLSIDLHDDGIDEAALTKLAEETGGKYYPAHDISRLQLIYEGLAQELQTTYTVTFPSLRQDYDGTSRDISVSVWRKGVQVSDDLRGGYNVPGVVVPEMDPFVYLGFLGALGALVVLPGALHRIAKK
jgi:VWFA-related protein